MRRPELRQAIEGPAQRAGLRLEAGLTERFLDEAGDEPGGLPLIAHALMETWMRRRGSVLTIDGFDAAGGVAGAIAQSAEQAYARLTPPDRTAVRQLFLRLVSPGEDTPDTRRRLSWEDLDPDERMSVLIEQLARDRLLTVDDRGVELVHETLIQAWPRLADWIEEARDDLRMHQRVARAAAEWSAQGRDPDLLYRGAPLANVLDWQDRAQVELTGASAAYLEASRLAREAEEQADAAAQKRRRRVRTVAFSALSVFAVAALAASIVAFVALGHSRDNETEAEERLARGLATQGEALASTNPKLALALAAESAARVDPIPPEAQQAMAIARQSLSRQRIVPGSDPIPVGDVVTSVVTPDGSTLITGARDGTVRLWDTATGEDTTTSTGPSAGIEEAAVDPGGRWFVTVGADGLWRWDLMSEDKEGVFVDQGSAALWSVAISPEGDRVVTAGEDGVVQSYDTSTWKPSGEPFTADVDFLSVAFTPDGERVLAGTGDGRVFLWDADDGSELGAPIEAHGSDDVWELAIDPAGRSVATASSDGTVKVWSLDTGALEATPFVDAAGVRSLEGAAGIAWSPDGTTLWVSGEDGLVHEWDRETETELGSSATGHEDLVSDASISSDGTVLATLGRDQDVRLWDIGAGEPITQLVVEVEEPLFGVAVSGDGRLTAAGDGNGVVHVVDAAGDTIELEGHEGRVFGVAFLPDDRLVTAGDDGSIRLWDASTGRSIEVVEAAAPEPFTSVAVSESGATLATSSIDGVIRVWSVASLAEPVAETPPRPTEANKVVFTPSGDIAAAYSDGMVRFWDQSGEPVGEPLEVDSDGDAAHSVAVSSDGQRLAAATATDGVTLWDLSTRSRGMELNGQPVVPVDVAFTPDGAALVSSTRDGIVSLWNAATGQAIGPRFEHHGGAVWRIAVSPNSGVVTASLDGTVQTLDVLDLERACDLSSGSLDRRARDRYLADRDPTGCS
jgi:WD40 repeat protein